jgi:hypothetical protein
MECRERSITMTEPGGSLHVVFGAAGAIRGAVVTELLHAGRTVAVNGEHSSGGRGWLPARTGLLILARRRRPVRPVRSVPGG